MVTLAPAIDACFASTTRPAIRDVLVCADAVNGQTANRTTAISCRTVRRMERPPLVVERRREKAESATAALEGAARDHRKRRNTRFNLLIAAVYPGPLWRQGFLPRWCSFSLKNTPKAFANFSPGLERQRQP